MKFIVRGFIGAKTISCIHSTEENAMKTALEYLNTHKCESVSIHRIVDGEKS